MAGTTAGQVERVSRIPRNDVSTGLLSHASRALAAASALGAALAVTLIVTLIVVDRNIDPTWRFISEYQLGSWGGFMSLAFLALASSATTLLIGIRSQVATRGGRIGLGFLAVSALGFLLAGSFRTDPIDATTGSIDGIIHSIAAVLGGFIPLAAYLIGWSLARNVAWRAHRRALWWVTTVAIAANLASIAQQFVMAAGGGFGPNVALGWPNRLFVLAMALWLLATALLVHKAALPPAAETEQAVRAR